MILRVHSALSAARIGARLREIHLRAADRESAFVECLEAPGVIEVIATSGHAELIALASHVVQGLEADTAREAFSERLLCEEAIDTVREAGDAGSIALLAMGVNDLPAALRLPILGRLLTPDVVDLLIRSHDRDVLEQVAHGIDSVPVDQRVPLWAALPDRRPAPDPPPMVMVPSSDSEASSLNATPRRHWRDHLGAEPAERSNPRTGRDSPSPSGP